MKRVIIASTVVQIDSPILYRRHGPSFSHSPQQPLLLTPRRSVQRPRRRWWPRVPETTSQRLLDADKEQQNWITHHKNYSAQRFSTLDQINAGNVKGPEGRLDDATRRCRRRRHLVARRPRGHADRRGRLHVRHRRLGIGLQDRYAWREGDACFGRWTPRPTTIGRAQSPAAASTIAASDCTTIW